MPPYRPSALQTERHLNHSPIALEDPFYPRFWQDKLEQPHGRWHTDYRPRRHKPRGVFVCDMGDLFGKDVPQGWTDKIMGVINSNRNDRFYLLTKQPQRLVEFSPFPPNCWVGATLTLAPDEYGKDHGIDRFATLGCLKSIEAKVKYISFEPLLGALWAGHGYTPTWWAEALQEAGVKWLIMGACTGTENEMRALEDMYNLGWGPEQPSRVMPRNQYADRLYTFQPKLEWVREIAGIADRAGIPLFLKNNLYPIYLGNPQDACYFMFKDARLKQEVPQ